LQHKYDALELTGDVINDTVYQSTHEMMDIICVGVVMTFEHASFAMIDDSPQTNKLPLDSIMIGQIASMLIFTQNS